MYDPSERKAGFQAIIEIKRIARGLARREAGLDERYPWGIDNNRLGLYSSLTHPDRDEIPDKLRRRNELGRKTFAMDLAGHGDVLRDLPLTGGGLAITLVDTRLPELIKSDDARNISVLDAGFHSKVRAWRGADLFSNPTWEETRRWLDVRGAEGFDEVLCLPYAGFDPYMGIDQATFFNLGYYLVQNIWNVLNPEFGTFRLQNSLMRNTEPDIDIPERWFKQLEKAGIDATFKSFIFKLVRTPGSLDTLPPLLPTNIHTG